MKKISVMLKWQKELQMCNDSIRKFPILNTNTNKRNAILEFLEDLRNLDVETDKRSELLRFMSHLYANMPTRFEPIERIVDRYLKNLSNSSEAN